MLYYINTLSIILLTLLSCNKKNSTPDSKEKQIQTKKFVSGNSTKSTHQSKAGKAIDVLKKSLKIYFPTKVKHPDIYTKLSKHIRCGSKKKKPLICIGKNTYKVIKFIKKHDNSLIYKIEDKKTKCTYTITINKNNRPSEGKIKTKLFTAKKLNSLCKDHKYVPLIQKHYSYVNRNGMKFGHFVISEHIEGESLKEKLTSTDTKELEEILKNLIIFIVEVSNNCILLNKLNFNNITIPNESEKKFIMFNNISLAKSTFKKDKSLNKHNVAVAYLKKNIENLHVLWYWYKNKPRERQFKIEKSDMSLIYTGRISSRTIEKKSKEAERFMPIDMSRENENIFHAFIKTLLEIYKKPKHINFLSKNFYKNKKRHDHMVKEINKKFKENLKKINRQSRRP